jgi:hypothetical protein
MEVFNVMEERRECEWPDNNCDLYHVEVTPADEFKQPDALVTTSYEEHLPGRDVYGDTWWIGLPVQRCTAYTWDAKREAFIENPEATEAYCSHLGPQRSLAPLNRSPAP